MKRVMLGLVAGSVLLGGCAAPHSETPIATNVPTSNQLKLQAASHWQLIAQDMAGRLTASLDRAPLYVHQSEQQSQFERAFNQELISSLLAAGYPVMLSPNNPGTRTVEVSAQALAFAPGRKQARTLIGVPTVLAAGLWAIGEAVTMAPGDAVGAGALGGLALTEAIQWFTSEKASGPTPRTEIIVTARVVSPDRYLAQVTSAYYTTETDARLYRTMKDRVSIPVRGGQQ